MKNKIFYIIFFLITFDIAYAESFNFQTKKIEIVNENKLIKADFGKAISKDGNLIINADKFIYQIKNKILKASGNGSIIVKNKDHDLAQKTCFDERNIGNIVLLETSEKNIEELRLWSKENNFSEIISVSQNKIDRIEV